MPLLHDKTNFMIFVTALIGVFLLHGGLIYAITYAGRGQEMHIEFVEPTMTMSQITLAGVDTAKEVTNQHDDEDQPSEAVEAVVEQSEPIEETPEKIEEPVVEPEPVIEPPKEEIVAVKKPTPDAPKIQQPKKEVKKPQPKPKKQEAKPENKRQSKRVDHRVLNMQEVSVLAKPSPQYPRSVIMRRVGGTTVLLIKINEKGHAVSVKIEKSSGNEQIDKAAEKAGYKVRLKPYVVNGQAQSFSVRIPYQLKF